MSQTKEKNPAKNRYNLCNRVKEITKSNGDISYRLDEHAIVEPGLRKYIKFLLPGLIRRHAQYQTCCRIYEEGVDLIA